MFDKFLELDKFHWHRRDKGVPALLQNLQINAVRSQVKNLILQSSNKAILLYAGPSWCLLTNFLAKNNIRQLSLDVILYDLRINLAAHSTELIRTGIKPSKWWIKKLFIPEHFMFLDVLGIIQGSLGENKFCALNRHGLANHFILSNALNPILRRRDKP